MSKRHPQLWFYTVQKDLPYLLASGEIMPTLKTIFTGEKPSIWFSTNPVWEHSSNRMCSRYDGSRVMGDKKTTYLQYGLLRIEVPQEVAPHKWRAYRRMSGVDKKEADLLKKIARKQGARPREWRMGFSSISREQWIAIETWNWQKQTWQPHLIEDEKQPADLKIEDCLGD